ncbi:uncharacterized protein A4U43_C08F13310 [Asparagus officinalis]|nr:uncharacterized protein A4U43_C08F13310 [Asparagus officinalis]
MEAGRRPAGESREGGRRTRRQGRDTAHGRKIRRRESGEVTAAVDAAARRGAKGEKRLLSVEAQRSRGVCYRWRRRSSTVGRRCLWSRRSSASLSCDGVRRCNWGRRGRRFVASLPSRQLSGLSGSVQWRGREGDFGSARAWGRRS